MIRPMVQFVSRLSTVQVPRNLCTETTKRKKWSSSRFLRISTAMHRMVLPYDHKTWCMPWFLDSDVTSKRPLARQYCALQRRAEHSESQLYACKFPGSHATYHEMRTSYNEIHCTGYTFGCPAQVARCHESALLMTVDEVLQYFVTIFLFEYCESRVLDLQTLRRGRARKTSDVARIFCAA